MAILSHKLFKNVSCCEWSGWKWNPTSNLRADAFQVFALGCVSDKIGKTKDFGHFFLMHE